MAFRCTVLVLVSLVSLAVAAATPDVDEIVRRHLTAIGGAARWQSIDSLVVRGAGEYGNFTWVWKRPGKMRTEERERDGAVPLVTAYDGSVGWQTNPFRSGAPKKLGAPELQRWQSGVAIRSDLLDLKGATLSLVGREKVAGRDAYKLSLEHPGRGDVFLWIDAESYLLVQRARTAAAPWGEVKTVATPLRDYRNVNGVMIPHLIGGTKLVTEVNAAIDDALFAPPQTLR